MATGIILALIGLYIGGHVVWGDWSSRIVEAVS